MDGTAEGSVAASRPAVPSPSGDQTATGQTSAAATRSGKEAALVASQGLQSPVSCRLFLWRYEQQLFSYAQRELQVGRIANQAREKYYEP